jgi:hypothetical protein
MSRDFILVFSGGLVSLVTTLVVLFVMDYYYRHEQKSKVERPTQSTGGYEATSKPAAVQAPVSKNPDPKSVVLQVAKADQSDVTLHPPVVELTSKPQADEESTQSPSADQTPISNVAEAATAKLVVDATPKPKLDDQPIHKSAVGPKVEPKIEEKPVHQPAVEPPVRPAIVDQASKPKHDEDLVEKPAVQAMPEVKAAEPVAREVARDQESRPGAGVAAKPKPPHMVPPEKIKKKTHEENAARPAKEHDG